MGGNLTVVAKVAVDASAEVYGAPVTAHGLCAGPKRGALQMFIFRQPVPQHHGKLTQITDGPLMLCSCPQKTTPGLAPKYLPGLLLEPEMF